VQLQKAYSASSRAQNNSILQPGDDSSLPQTQT
jgi:hypothetical protein